MTVTLRRVASSRSWWSPRRVYDVAIHLLVLFLLMNNIQTNHMKWMGMMMDDVETRPVNATRPDQETTTLSSPEEAIELVQPEPKLQRNVIDSSSPPESKVYKAKPTATDSFPSRMHKGKPMLIPSNTTTALKQTKTPGKKASSKPQRVVIVMNAFIPKKLKGHANRSPEKSVLIVEIQLKQIAAKLRGSKTLVYVNTVGNGNFHEVNMDERCRKAAGDDLQYRRVSKKNSSGELDTLSLVYNYCKTEPNSTRVVYMHNKGSFTVERKNEYWRDALTHAVIHDDCLNPPNDSCNVCGLNFAQYPRQKAHMFPGNFFSATCGYVRKLLHPLEFTARVDELAKKAVRREKVMVSSMKPWEIGTLRYAPEHWIGSHPDLVPCDVSRESHYWYWLKERDVPQEFEWSMWPRNTDMEPYWLGSFRNYTSTSDRFNNYGSLPGLMYKWVHLYNSTPAASSWVWTAYPDGALWRKAYRKYGGGVFQALAPSKQ